MSVLQRYVQTVNSSIPWKSVGQLGNIPKVRRVFICQGLLRRSCTSLATFVHFPLTPQFPVPPDIHAMFHSIFPMLSVLNLACFFLSMFFYVPKKTGIVHTWIHENVSVAKWNKIRHACLLGFISLEANLGKSWGAEQCVVPSVALFSYSINACDVFIHQDTFQISPQRNGAEICNFFCFN